MNITLTLTEEEVKILENDLLDIEEWIENVLRNKISRCKQRLISEWFPKLIQDPKVENIMANENDLLTQIFSHQDYKNREQIEVINES